MRNLPPTFFLLSWPGFVSPFANGGCGHDPEVDEAVDEVVELVELVFLSAGLAGWRLGLEYPISCNKASAAALFANFLLGPVPWADKPVAVT